MSKDPLLWRAAGGSDVGKVRRVNEDAWIARPELALFAVADGLGGHTRGDRASRVVVEELARLDPAPDPADLEAAARAALERAHARIRSEALAIGATMGTTVALLLAREARAVLLWAGDSRIYRLRGDRLEPLSRDHSRVQELAEAGLISAEEARRHPLRNLITRAVGTGERLELERRALELRPGDLVLLCSDGLTGPLEEREIAAILERHRLDAVGPLIEATLARGAPDNVTVVVAAFGVDPDRTVPGLGSVP